MYNILVGCIKANFDINTSIVNLLVVKLAASRILVEDYLVSIVLSLYPLVSYFCQKYPNVGKNSRLQTHSQTYKNT